MAHAELVIKFTQMLTEMQNPRPQPDPVELSPGKLSVDEAAGLEEPPIEDPIDQEAKH